MSICSTGNTVTPTTLTLPVSAMSDFERYEGMRVHFSQTLTANETFTLGRFGEVRLAEGGRLYTPTAVTTPGAAAIAQEDLNQRRSFVLDDGNNQQNIDPTRYPTGGLSAANTLRSGYTVDDLDGVFDERFSTYRVQPVGPGLVHSIESADAGSRRGRRQPQGRLVQRPELLQRRRSRRRLPDRRAARTRSSSSTARRRRRSARCRR